MDNQHRKITGYRELTQAELDLINTIKSTGLQLEALCGELQMHITAQSIAALDNKDEQARLDAAQPGRWLALARTDFQTGLMAAVRAVAQPTSF